MVVELLLHCVLWSWQEEEEMEEVCGAPGQPVARHTLKQNNIVIPIEVIEAVSCYFFFFY